MSSCRTWTSSAPCPDRTPRAPVPERVPRLRLSLAAELLDHLDPGGELARGRRELVGMVMAGTAERAPGLVELAAQGVVRGHHAQADELGLRRHGFEGELAGRPVR